MVLPIIQNRLNRFTILYLPKRHLRFKAKQKREVYNYELESDEFEKRQDDFVIIEQEPEEEEQSNNGLETEEKCE